MAEIDALIAARVAKPTGIVSGEAAVWNGTGWDRSSVTRIGPTSLGSGTPDATKFLRGDGAWAAVAASQLVGYKTTSSSPSTAGTTFGTGVDLFATAISFTADGTSDYLFFCSFTYQTNTGAGGQNATHINLDGADAGTVDLSTLTAAGNGYPYHVAGVLSAPSAAAHTFNLRFRVGGGTGQVVAGAGGVGANAKGIMALYKLA